MKTIKIDNKPSIQNIKEVNRVIIDIYFPIQDNMTDAPKRNILIRLLSNYQDKYKDNYSFYNKMDSLYILKYSIRPLLFKEINYLRFSLILPKENIIDEFNLEDALKFFKDSIYKPYIVNNEFSKDIFDIEKDYLVDNGSKYPNNIYDYVTENYWNFIDKEEEIGLHHKHYMKLLKDTTSKDVYDYYVNNILNNKNYFIYIYGNVKDKKSYLDRFNKVFKLDNNKKNYKVNFCKFRDNFKYTHKEEITKYNQSVLCFNYAIKGMLEKELILFDMFFDILDSKENALIFNELRTKNNLIYSCKLNQKRHYGFFNILVYYNDIDYKDIINYVDIAIKSLYKKEVFNECKDRLVKSLKYTLLYKEDDPFDKVYSNIETKICNGISFHKRINIVENTTYEEFIKFLDKLTLVKTYLFIGGDNNA